ncbi:hypothetical protein RRF57_000943 [Xylaria bambusicola]|uniref:Uncharacterized protein n=1 Tax=Xylaria bambusicola TaxID=326684 RepID=A0AAN7UD43_9PEZI
MALPLTEDHKTLVSNANEEDGRTLLPPSQLTWHMAAKYLQYVCLIELRRRRPLRASQLTILRCRHR